MIPRAARRLETTLLSSRQALPRPARLYSTPSKVRSAPATATAPAVSPQPDFPFPTSKQPELSSFLSRPLPVTLIPSPEPLDTQRNALDPWFIDSQSYEIVGIIDACLHNFHDIPRAQAMLERIRSRVGSPALSTRLYNSFIIAYTQLATKEPEKKGVWLTQASKIYYILQDEVDGVLPNTKTFALMFDMLKQHGESDRVTTKEILSHAVKRGIPVTEIVTNPYFSEPERSMEISQMLSSAAFNLGFKDVLKDLGHFNAVARGNEVLDDVPDVMPVQSKRIVNGEEEKYTPLKIESLRASLNDVIEAKAVFENNNNARQEHLEASAYDLALKQLEACNKDYASNVPRDPDLQYWIWTWHSGLEKRLKDLIKSAKLNVAEGRARVSRTAPQESVEARQQWTMINDIMPCLTAVSPERLSLMTILELIRMQGVGTVQNGMKTTAALVAIGKNVEREYKSEICRQSGIPVPDYEITRGNYFSDMGYKFLHQRRLAAARSQDLDEQWQGDWSQAMRSKIGAFLVNTLESVAKVRREKVNPNTGEVITEDQPAIYNAYEFVRGHKLGVLKFNEVVSERIAKDSLINTVHARHLPMLVKPKPWVGYRQGGYIYNKCVAMRFKECAEQEAYLQKATEDGKMEHIYAGLDVLGSTPWQINKDIFKIVLEVWNSGKRVGKIPPATYDVPEPVLEEGKERDIQAKAHYITRHRVWSHGSSNNHSDRCSVNYKIEIARAFLGDTIYMPHNLDFRGRAYPIPPHLNHIGDDLSRSLLKFAEGKPLGVRGLHWLKIHAANLYGYDKANFDERVEWAEERLEQIKESAKNPLEGTRWWLSAGDPWQFLACCMELTKAMELEDPTTYVCTLPVHQDGTCNGLQHYAALGGDIRGAQQVNLLASDRPSDVYTHISQHVEADMDKEAEAGNELAKMLKGKITRKVVKQTVMTTVYGVTFVGAREQIERQLRDRGDIPAEMCWGASSYLAKKVLGTIGDAFTGAKAIQDWLNLCARLITKSVPEEKLIESQNRNTTSMADVKKMQMTSVIWTTKLGLPIVQPYRKVVRKQIRTSMQSLFISDPRVLSEVNSIKQASAFPPNFVHSLDATHMMLTALKCREHGLTFASVHDSYWTHACDIDEMSEIIRDTFISLHSSGILSALEKEFRDRYKNHYIALTHIFGQNGTRFAQKLRAAGTRIYAHPDQALELQSIKDLVIFTDDKSSIAVVNGVDTTLSEGENGESVGAYSSLLDGKFVRLSDLMPPLPKRGDLNVEDIKNSPYFFS